MVDARYYTPQTAAELLGTDDEQILAWIHSGELEAVNIAKSLQGKRPRWRIAESALGRCLLARRNPAALQTVVPKSVKRPKPKQYV
jgi:excisionase family DNA binding protein